MTELVAERVEKTKGGSRRSGCCRPPGRRAMRGRRATSGGWSRRGRRCGGRDNHRGRRPAVWSPGEHLVIDWGVLGGLHVFCAVLAWSPVCGSCASPPTSGPTRRWRCSPSASRSLGGVPGDGAGRPDGLPEGRGGRQRGGAHRGLRAVRRALRVPARLLRGRRPGVEGHRGEPGRLRQDRPDGPAGTDGVGGEPFADVAAANTAAAAWCVEVNAAVHSEICAVPAERLVIERELLAPLPSLRAEHRAGVGDPQGRPALLCPVRLGPLLGARSG